MTELDVGIAPGAPDSADGFTDWVRPHISVLSAVAARHVGRSAAPDVVQEALLRAWRRRSTFTPTRGSARAWLSGILFNQIRRQRVRRPFDNLRDLDRSDIALEGRIADRATVERALHKLSRRQKDVISLFYLADLPIAEVGSILGLSEGPSSPIYRKGGGRFVRRWETAMDERGPDELAVDLTLRSWAEGQLSSAPPVAAPQFAHGTERRHRARLIPVVSASVAVVAAISIGVAAVLMGHDGKNPTASNPSSGTSASSVAPADQILQDGMLATGSGWVVSVPGRPVRFCAPVLTGGSLTPTDPHLNYCDIGVNAVGVSLATLSDRVTGNGAVAGEATLTGTYDSGTLTVTEQAPPKAANPTRTPQTPPCAPPAGGWPSGPSNENLGHQPLEQYEVADPGTVTASAQLRPSPTQVILYVVTTDPPASVVNALKGAYGARLCVTQSRYTSAQLAEGESALAPGTSPGDSNGVYAIGNGDLDANLQPVVGVSLVRITAQAVAIAGGQRPGIIQLQPWLTAAR